jgi:hypothetical protein
MGSHNTTAVQVMSNTLMSNALELQTTAEYGAHPFLWGGSITAVKYIANDTRRATALVRAQTAFADHAWDSTDDWSSEMVASYETLLKNFYSMAALRLLAVANRITIEGIDRGTDDNTGASEAEKKEIIFRLVESKTPLCSPSYLSSYARRVREVAAGDEPGGHVFADDQEDHSNQMEAGTLPPPTDQDSTNQSVQAVLSESQATTALLRERLAQVELRERIRTASALPAPTQNVVMTPAMMSQFCLQMSQQTHAGTGTSNVAPPKPKTGKAKVLQDIKTSIKAHEMPAVIKLARANLARLMRETKADNTSRKIMLGGAEGLSLTMPGADTDTATVTSNTDSQLWSGLSAFNHLFSIMAAMPEEDFSRASLSDLLTLWKEVWDSPLGTHQQKLKAVQTFYEDHVEDLGKGVWLKQFNTDSRFLLENFKGDNPPVCKHCLGSGESTGRTANAEGAGGAGAHTTAGNGSADNGSVKKGKSKTTPKRKTFKGLCASMLIQSKTCDFGESCGFAHSPCASCGGTCKSARACSAWDQAAVHAKHGSQIDRINSAVRRKSNR